MNVVVSNSWVKRFEKYTHISIYTWWFTKSLTTTADMALTHAYLWVVKHKKIGPVMQQHFYEVHNLKLCHDISYDIHMVFYFLSFLLSSLILNDR